MIWQTIHLITVIYIKQNQTDSRRDRWGKFITNSPYQFGYWDRQFMSLARNLCSFEMLKFHYEQIIRQIKLNSQTFNVLTMNGKIKRTLNNFSFAVYSASMHSNKNVCQLIWCQYARVLFFKLQHLGNLSHRIVRCKWNFLLPILLTHQHSSVTDAIAVKLMQFTLFFLVHFNWRVKLLPNCCIFDDE